jgi:hypothetical protein
MLHALAGCVHASTRGVVCPLAVASPAAANTCGVRQVGASASECDTIPGRQCMASCFFLLKQFEDVLIYLKSIKTYFYNDDDFNWNYGLAKV